LSTSSFDCSEVGTNTIWLRVTDVNGNVDSASAIITVQDVIKPTVVTQNLTVSLDATGSGSITATQVDNGSTDNCTISTRTLSTSSFDCSEVGTNTIWLRVTDVNGNVDSASAVITVQDVIKPTVVTQNLTVSLNASGSGSITAAQVDNGSTDNCTIATRTLSTSSFDCSNVGNNTIWLRVTDVNGNVDSSSAVITVQDIIKPTVVTQNLTVSLDATGSGSITATQVDNGSTDNCSIATRTLSTSSFDCSNVGNNTIWLRVTDVNGNVDSSSAVITVQDIIKPTVVTQNLTVSLDATGSGSITATQVDNGSTDNCTISTRTLSKYSFDCSNVGANTVYLIVTDVNGNVDSASAVITVQDVIKPTVITTPSNIALGYCDAAYTYSLPTATDNCGVTVTQVAGLASGSVFPVGITTNTFEIKDPSGNTVTTSFTVDIRDRYMPFDTTNMSLCQNDAQIDLSRGYTNLTFTGQGIDPDEITFNPIEASSGNYLITRIFIDSMGCISKDSIKIEVRSIPNVPIIDRVASDQIVTAIEYDKYQWYRNGTALEGKTEQLLRVYELGIYSVLVGNSNNCFAVSNGYGFGIPVNEEQITNEGTVKVYPNPTEGLIFIEMSDGDLIHNLSITNGLGVEVLTQVANTSVARMDMSSLPPGTYFLQITSASTNASIKLVKM
jgi:Ni,Fe-hydrogenase III small subunit